MGVSHFKHVSQSKLASQIFLFSLLKDNLDILLF